MVITENIFSNRVSKLCSSLLSRLGYSLQSATKFIAYIGIFSSLLDIFYYILLSIKLFEGMQGAPKIEISKTHRHGPFLRRNMSIGTSLNYFETELRQIVKLQTGYQILILLWWLTTRITTLITNLILLKGSRQRNLKKIKFWLSFCIVNFILLTPTDVCISAYVYAEEHWHILSYLLAWTFNGFSIATVFHFLKELRMESHMLIYSVEREIQTQSYLIHQKKSDRHCCGIAFVSFVFYWLAGNVMTWMIIILLR